MNVVDKILNVLYVHILQRALMELWGPFHFIKNDEEEDDEDEDEYSFHSLSTIHIPSLKDLLRCQIFISPTMLFHSLSFMI